jgi:hypothetical protein
MTTSRLYVDPDYVARAAEDDKFALAFARIESHYFVHGGFFKVCLPPASTSAPLPPRARGCAV